MARGNSGASGARRLAQSVRHGMDAETPDELAAYPEYGDNPNEDEEAEHGGFMLEEFCRWDGNIAELFTESEEGKRKLQEIGQLVLREYKLDESARQEWKKSAERALETAGQKKGEKKTYPFNNAADVRFPLLTTASIQFASRAYPNIVRGDEVVQVKINGEDVDSAKADRSDRVASFCNDQIIYQCPEWESGTDQLLHQLPITGAGFRKVYWDSKLRRPRFDYAPALKVVIPIDAPSIEMAPRVTHVLDSIYPYDYEARVASGQWLTCETKSDTSDTQKPIIFLEQCRYIDLDEDGLSEPYIVTVHESSGAVVRIDPAFDESDIKREPMGEDGAPGKIRAVTRLLPWVDYCFLPDPQGGAYGIGFGKLLEEISDTINTLLNQMIDAGHWSNTNTGFIGAGLKVRGGTISLEPNVFKMLDGVQNVQQAIQRLEFPGPSAVSFNLVDMLLGAAKDITAIKDVLAGDMPGGQHVAEGTVMALIEQSLQVFTSIYKRIYRSMRREFELQCRLNQRYLDPADYQKFLDARPKPAPQQPEMQGAAPPAGIGHNGGPPMGPMDMAPPGAPPIPMDGDIMPAIPVEQAAQMQQGPMPMPQPGQGGAVVPFPVQQPQAMQPPPDPQIDFNMEDLDIRPIADPSALTDMQRMAKAQFKMGFLNDPAANRLAILKSVFRDARIPHPEEFLVEKNPVMEKMAELETALKEATVAKTNAEAQLAQANAQKIGGEGQNAEHERALRSRELDQKDRELEQKDAELRVKHNQEALEAFRADMEDADREVRLVMEAARERREETKEEREARERQADRDTQLIIAAQRASGKVTARESSSQQSGAQQAELSKVLEGIQKMSAESQERIAASIGKMLDGMADSNSQIAGGLKAMAESIERSNKIALAPTELVKGSDGKPAGSRKRLD